MPGFWSAAFRVGLYDLLMPVNYDRSLKAAFEALELRPTDHLLDGGCGSGRLLVHAQDWQRQGGRLTGVDIDKAGLAYARRRAKRLGVADRVQFFQGDLCDLAPLGLPLFDNVVTHFATYTIPTDVGRRRAVQELASLLKPGGRFVFVVPSERYTPSRVIADAHLLEEIRTDIPAWRRFLRRRLVYPLSHVAMKRIEARMERGAFHRYTEPEVRKHLAAAGIVDAGIEATYGGCGWRAVGRKG
jgi:SAM-dependent methyltransferase